MSRFLTLWLAAPVVAVLLCAWLDGAPLVASAGEALAAGTSVHQWLAAPDEEDEFEDFEEDDDDGFWPLVLGQ